MFRQSINYIIPLLSILVLCSCKTEFSIDTYTSDFFIEDNVETTATMSVEIPSCDSKEIEEYREEFLSLFSNNANAKIIDCKKEGLTDFLVAQLSADIASENSDKDLVIFRIKEPDKTIEDITYSITRVTASLNKNFLTRVDMLMEKNYQKLKFENISFELNLINDSKKDINYTARYVWVNNEPYLEKFRETIKNREKIIIRTNNLVNELILNHKQPVIFFLYEPK